MKDILSFNQKKKGFTLVELLVVMAILGILAVVSLANFRTSQIKARDAQRKHDMRQITNALEAYISDHGSYPDAGTGGDAGKIVACSDSCGVPEGCEWEGTSVREMCDENSTVYMIEVPGDPQPGTSQPNYCYWSDNTSYKLYVNLENEKDPERFEEPNPTRSCGGALYNYGTASTNTSP